MNRLWLQIVIGLAFIQRISSRCNCQNECLNGHHCYHCNEGWYGPTCQKENIALNQHTNQTSTYTETTYMGYKTNYFSSNLAVDGNSATNFYQKPLTCSHTKGSSDATWTVYLGNTVTIRYLKIFLRRDFQNRNRGMTIYINERVCYMFPTQNDTFVKENGNNIDCEQPITGNTVAIRASGFVTLCEVQVFQCANHWFGRDCEHQCNCFQPNKVCNKFSGTCLSGCALGYTGPNCLIACPRGFYGHNCNSTCGYCVSKDQCNSRNGTCADECQPGWTGTKCSQGCEDGKYGQNCSLSCGRCKQGVCNKTNGVCESGCDTLFVSPLCQEAEKLEGNPSAKVGSIAGAVTGAVLVAVLAVAAFILIRKRRRESDSIRKPVPKEEKRATGQIPTHFSDSLNPQEEATPPRDSLSVEEETLTLDDRSTYYNWVPPIIPLGKLQDIIKEKKQKKIMETEFKMIPYGVRRPHDAGKDPNNKKRNRFLYLFPYDETRVVLKGGSHDYINANYITGYTEATKYIGTQGPNAATIEDFWRMVWQERVEQIVMLTKLKELGKRKCEQYWPNVNETKKFGTLTVTTLHTTERRDFIVTSFMIAKSKHGKRTVTHYHFTTWPDHGVPSAPALVGFWTKVKAEVEGTVPLVVHCSAGVGRTGTFIALDCLMEGALQQNQVNVYMCVTKMREARMNMVQTLSQYKFVYDAVLEAVKSQGTFFTLVEFGKKFGDGASFTKEEIVTLEQQYEAIQGLKPVLTEKLVANAMLSENRDKNRCSHILPADKSRPYLSTRVPKRNDYINAVFLSTYHRHNSLIVTQTPIPDTVVDFWRLVYDHDCFTIICLDNSKAAQTTYPKDIKTPLTCGPLRVSFNSKSGNDITEQRLKIQLVKERKEGNVTVLTPVKVNEMLQNVSSFLEFVTRVDRLTESVDHTLLIHCSNGADISGVFCAVLNIVSRLRHNSDVNVFQAVRELQSVRPQFVSTFGDYKLCYEMAKEYNRTSSVYANAHG